MMTMSRTVKGLALALLAALAVAAPMSAHAGGRGKGKGKEMIQRIIQRLDLTQDQQTRIKAIRDGFKTQHASLIEEVKGLHKQVREARKAGDKARVESLRTQMGPRAEQLKAAREQMKQQILAVLTPEQRAEVEAMKAERKEKREKKGGKAGKAQRGGASID